MLRQINQTLRSSRAAVDLATIIVGVVVIGIIGAVSAATIFALVPWMQDRGTKQQLMLVATAENTNKGAYDVYTANLDTDIVNTYNANIAIFSNEKDCWAAFKTSNTGKTFYSSSKSADPQQVASPWPSSAPTTYPSGCPWPNAAYSSGNLMADPKYDTGKDWDNYYGPTVTTETKITHSAPQSRKIVTINPYDGVIVWQNKQVSNGNYYAGMWLKGEVGTKWHVALRTDGPYSEGMGGNLVSATGDWQYVVAYGNINNSPNRIGIQVRAEGVSPGRIAYFDDVSMYTMK